MDVKFVIIFCCAAVFGDAAKILGVFYFPSKSHHILGSSVLKALAKRGHQVTMLSPFPLESPIANYEDIELTGMLEYKQGNLEKMVTQIQNLSFFEQMSKMMDQVDVIDNMFFNHESVKNLVKSNRKFDLVIQCWFGNDAYWALPYYLGASSIAFSTIGSSPMSNKLMMNPAPYSYVPNMMPAFPADMTFKQRIANAFSVIAFELYVAFYWSRKQELLRQKYFPDAPTVDQLAANVSLVMLNSHYSIESPRPYVPAMIQIGGLHLEEPEELKGDIKEFLDGATDGAILFSLGSNAKSSNLPKERLQAIVECFSKLSAKVLWKFEGDGLDVPKNVKIKKWLPQKDVLAHENIKLFVTHGGLLSTTEAVYHGVPMVGIPLFGDQESNVENGVNGGYMLKVPLLELTRDTLTVAIDEVLNNPKYRENIKQRSLVFRDSPLKPLDKAVFWVEYVLRHKGAHHLKTSALKLMWYQYYLLDIAGLFLVIFIISKFILRKIFGRVKRIVWRNASVKDKAD